MRPWVSTRSLLVVACFSRHREALAWARPQLESRFGPIALTSPDFDFDQTTYYETTMGSALIKRFHVFARFLEPQLLPDAKNATIAIERQLIEASFYPETRPLNLDPGYLQLGKFLLATTKDQSHRIYLRDNIFAEVTLRWQKTGFEAWPWTYADYRGAGVLEFLNRTRNLLYRSIRERWDSLPVESSTL